MGRLSENTQIFNFIKIRIVRVEFFHANGQTDMMLLTTAFCNILNLPKNCQAEILCHTCHKAL
jgi:hypothetical protein